MNELIQFDPYIYFMKDHEFNTDWRKVASSIYRKPIDSKILGSAEVDITDLEAYISRRRAEGLKLTLTHFFTLAVARAASTTVPEINTLIRRGRVVVRNGMSASVSVLLPGGQLGSVVIQDIDKMTLKEVVEAMSAEIKNSRKGSERVTMNMKHLLGSIPWPFRGWIMNFLKTIVIKWGIPIPALGLDDHSFGSYVVSNIGSLGLDMGFPALFPISNVSLVLIQGGVSLKPWVVNGEVVPRRILSLGAALDHRVLDGSHGGKLFQYLRYIIKHPEELEML